MEGRLYFLIYIIFLAYVAQKDYYNHQYKQQHVHVREWICYKTKIIRYYQTKVWNDTLFTLPGVKTHLDIINKPIEALLPERNIIMVPYSEEAELLDVRSDWKDKEDSLCFIIDEPLSICNLFDGCLFWPLFAPLKLVGWLFLLMFNETPQI